MDNRKKIVIMATSLILSLVVMTTATFAWLTLSTSPEVSGMSVSMKTTKGLLLSVDNSEDSYYQNISLSEAFANKAPLHPVSTADGIHWFLPVYTTEGELKDASEFIMDNLDDPNIGLRHGNVSLLDGSGNLLTGGALDQAKDFGSYVYADFWLKTDEDEGVKVRLSIPNEYISANNYEKMDDWEKEQGTYGTYVLPRVTVGRNGDNELELYSLSNNAETAIRLGFLVDPLNESEDYNRDFYIFEPNADMRSDGTVRYSFSAEDSSDADVPISKQYVLNYAFKPDEYRNNRYFVTNPIGYNAETGKGVVTEFNPSKLIVQKAGGWNTDMAMEVLEAGNSLNSNHVQTMGDFMTVDSNYTSTTNGRYFDTEEKQTSIAGSGVIVTLEKDKPVKVRLYVWLEGQDVDCWNDVAAGSFIVNLELAAEVLPAQNP